MHTIQVACLSKKPGAISVRGTAGLLTAWSTARTIQNCAMCTIDALNLCVTRSNTLASAIRTMTLNRT